MVFNKMGTSTKYTQLPPPLPIKQDGCEHEGQTVPSNTINNNVKNQQLDQQQL